MTLGLLRALTSAVGEELGLIRGQIMTRLASNAVPVTQIARGTGTATTVDGTHVSLSAGTFGSTAAPMIFRLLGGGSAGQQAVVLSVTDPTHIILASALPLFASVSWEVERPADTTLAVESTLSWSSAGEFFLGGVRHRYTGTTATTFTGITHWDGEAWVLGVAKAQSVGDVVVDYSRSRSAIDRIRRSFFAETAADTELTVLGTNHGRPRFQGLSDTEQFRAYLRATMFGPWGTRLLLWRVLDAVTGIGNWETFEDFTSPTDDFARIFVRRTNEDPTLAQGKAFVDGEVIRLPTSSTTITTPETPLRVGSVTLAPDLSARLVATGTASTADGIAITGTAGTFPARILRGDIIEALSGPRAGERAVVQSRVSSSQLNLGALRGHGDRVFSGASPAFAWRVIREVTDCRFQQPSADSALEYDVDTGTQAWTWQGTDTENNGAIVTGTSPNDPIFGDRTSIGVSAIGLTGYYRRQARVMPESNARFEVLCTPATSTILSTTDGRQSMIEIRDGERALAAGWFRTDGLHDAIALINATTGAALTPIYELPLTPLNYRTIVIEKRGRGPVVLSIDGLVVGTLPQASFAAATEHELRIGTTNAPSGGVYNNVRHIGWAIETETDYWASRSSAATTPGSPSRNVGGLGGMLQVGDVGRVLFLRRGTARNPDAGTVNGEWVVSAFVDANTATVTGRTRQGATTQRGSPSYLFLPPEFALSFPDALGHQIEVLTGPQAGVYTIAALRGADRHDLSRRLDGAVFDSLRLNSDGEPAVRDLATIVEVSNPPVGGFVLNSTGWDWRIVPTFPADSALYAELADTGTLAGSTATLRQALPITSPMPPVAIAYSTVYSAHVEAPEDLNGALLRWPLYVYDAWGLLREVLLDAGAEGVEINLDSLQRDAAGLHIVEP